MEETSIADHSGWRRGFSYSRDSTMVIKDVKVKSPKLLATVAFLAAICWDLEEGPYS